MKVNESSAVVNTEQKSTKQLTGKNKIKAWGNKVSAKAANVINMFAQPVALSAAA